MFSRARRSIVARFSVVAGAALALSLIPGVTSANAGPNGSLDPILPPGFPCIHTNVYQPVATWGWTKLDGSEPQFVDGPAGASGRGSLYLENARGPASYFHPGFSTPLNQLANQRNALGYMFDSTQATFQLRVRGANRTDRTPSGFTTLVWQPQYNGHSKLSSFVTANDLARGKWWSTQPIAGGPTQAKLMTLPEIAQQNPRAWVSEYGVRNASKSPGAHVDNIVYGCSKWDFEPGSGS